MKRLFSWLLGALAIATAVGALRKKAPEADPRPPAGEAPLPIVTAREARMRRVRSIAGAVVRRIREHNMPMIAGSLSYYAFLAVFPAAIAAVSIYGLVLDPEQLARHIESITSVLSAEMGSLVEKQLTAIVHSSDAGLGFASVLGIAGALWSASAGAKSLIVGVDIAYDTEENRPFLVLRGTALALTLGMVVFVVMTASLVTFLPDLFEALGARSEVLRLIELGRWPAIFLTVVVGLGLLYKIAPNRPARESPWISVGALAAAVTWVLATVGFSFYANSATRFNPTYGTLGGVIVLLLWFFLSGFIVLVGAELNAELESRR